MGLSDNSAINLYEVYGDVHSLNNSALLTLRSVLGPRSTNELKIATSLYIGKIHAGQ